MTAPVATIGQGGTGAFTQSGGTNASSSLYLGYLAGGSGTYNLSGSGQLSASGREVVGWSGSGTFRSPAGPTTAATISISATPAAAGSRNLGSGTGLGIGRVCRLCGHGGLSQSGGTHSVGTSLYSAGGAGGSGTYNLSGSGQLSAAGSLVVGSSGTATFLQSGGSNIPGTLYLGYFAAGSGTVSFSGGPVVGILRERGCFRHGGASRRPAGATARATPRALSRRRCWRQRDVQPQRQRPAVGILRCRRRGGLHAVRRDQQHEWFSAPRLRRRQQRRVHCQRRRPALGEHRVCRRIRQGDLRALRRDQHRRRLSLSRLPRRQQRHVQPQPAASSRRTGEYLGYYGAGTFSQSGGSNFPGTLYLGGFAGSGGTYGLSGSGQLSASYVYVTGTFTQSAGTNSISSQLVLGNNAGSGTYNLSGNGQLSASSEIVGGSGAGTFTQSGGTNGIQNNLALGSGGSGAYNLSGSGQVSAAYEFVGGSQPGTFTQSGGTNRIGSYLYLGNGPASGTYILSGSGRTVGGQRGRGLFRPGDLHAVRRDQYYRQRSQSRLLFRKQRHVQPQRRRARSPLTESRFGIGGLQLQRRHASGRQRVLQQSAHDAGHQRRRSDLRYGRLCRDALRFPCRPRRPHQGG